MLSGGDKDRLSLVAVFTLLRPHISTCASIHFEQSHNSTGSPMGIP